MVNIFENIGLVGEKCFYKEKYLILLIYNFWGFLNQERLNSSFFKYGNLEQIKNKNING